MTDWKNTLQDNEEQLTDEDLLKYLHENISEEEKYAFEKKATGAFESDALDGLQQIKDTSRIQNHVQQLHQKLPQLLRQRKKRSEKPLIELKWIVLTIILLLFICIAGYLFVHLR